jgi:Matrixin
MADDTLKVCFDRVVPPELVAVANRKAMEENPANIPPASPFEAAAVTAKLWRPGRTLRVRFLDGVPEVQRKVEQYAHRWSEHANIRLAFGSDPDAEIRISFEQQGSWSALGTDALVEEFFPKDQPTMNYGWLTPESEEAEYSRVVLHEFGHALGLIHEHQNPADGIQWNREVVYRALGGPPNSWDRATADHNVLNKYSRTITQFTEFDPRSIMLYSFPKEWTLDGREFGLNSVLSDTDKAFVRARYPQEARA